MNYHYKALFLDRDGVVNIDYGHVHKIENFVFVDGIFELCKWAKNKGYLIIIITNQAGIGKGLYTLTDFKILDNWMKEEFLKKDIKIEKTYFCPHKPEEHCNCRKPQPGMILQAVKEYSINPYQSILVGDKDSDIKAGLSMNLKLNILFKETSHQTTLEKLAKIL
jgi:D-glycero-D-manno-heptose 1,7-bisphosphate phosphatase